MAAKDKDCCEALEVGDVLTCDNCGHSIEVLVKCEADCAKHLCCGKKMCKED